MAHFVVTVNGKPIACKEREILAQNHIDGLLMQAGLEIEAAKTTIAQLEHKEDISDEDHEILEAAMERLNKEEPEYAITELA